MFLPLRDYNPTRTIPIITILLIVGNVAIFAYQNFQAEIPAEYFVYSSALIPYEITHFRHVELPMQNRFGQVVGYFPRTIPPWLSLFYSLFMHGGLLHIFGNMLFLWIFGNNVEDHLGKLRFIAFYLLAGIGASLIHVLFNFNSLVPVIGASGAVSGVMGAYLVLYPRARIRTLVFLFIFVTFIDIPAALFLLAWLAMQIIFRGGGGIAWLAHVGGFVLGIALCRLLGSARKPWGEIQPPDPDSELNVK